MRRYTLLTVFLFACIYPLLVAQETGTLIIESDSAYVAVKLNGEETGLFTPFSEELEVGEYDIEMVFSPLLSYKATVLVTAGQVTRISENSAQTNGNLLLSSSPSGADVYMGETFMGITPLAVKDISPGKYMFSVKKENYNDANVIVEVMSDKLSRAFAELAAGYGTISILANPEADIYIDENFEGKRMYNGRLSTGTHVIEVKKESFEPQVKVIEVEEGKSYSEFFQLEQVFGKVSITTSPSLAKVLLDGKMVGFSSMILDSVTVGEHTIKLVRDGYHTILKKINVLKNRTNYVGEELKTGLLVRTEPAAAQIYVNGEPMGKSPMILSNLDDGDYTIKLEKEGYPFVVKQVSHRKSKADSLKVKFDSGFMLTSDPAGAKIYLDSALAGTTPQMFKGLEGSHQFVIKKEGFADDVLDINFDDTDTMNYHAQLNSGYRVIVATNSPDAEIWVDGELLGTSRVEIPLTAGEHQLEFKNSEFYNDSEKTIVVSENGQEENIELSTKMCSITVISKPKKGTVTLNNTKSFNTHRKTILQGGLYSLKLESRGFKPIEDEIRIDEADEKFEYLMEPVNYRSKGTAVFLTMIWPGAGKAYLTRGEASTMGGFLFYGLVAGAYFTNEKSLDLSWEADQITGSDYNSQDERNQLYEDADNYKLYSDVMLYSAIGVWGINLIRTLATPSEKKRYEKLKVTSYYNPHNKSSNIGLVYNF